MKSIILLIYPYTPFIAEELYLNLPTHLESVMLETYPTVDKELLDDSGDKEINTLFNIIKEVRNYKITNKLVPNKSLELSINLRIKTSDDFINYLKRFTFSDISFVGNEIINMSGELINLDYCDLLINNATNKDEIIERLKKDIENEKNEILRCEKMLNNPNFIAKAPESKISQEKDKLELHKANLANLEEKLKKI